MAGRGISILASVLALGVAGPAMAQGDAVRAAHVAISGGDFATAERVLTAEQRIFPHRTEVLLNLAVVYASTGRTALAATLYDRVLTDDDAVMDLSADRTASAHSIARTGLRRLVPTQTASR